MIRPASKAAVAMSANARETLGCTLIGLTADKSKMAIFVNSVRYTLRRIVT